MSVSLYQRCIAHNSCLVRKLIEKRLYISIQHSKTNYRTHIPNMYHWHIPSPVRRPNAEHKSAPMSKDMMMILMMTVNKKDGYRQLNVRQLGSLRPWEHRGKCYINRKRIQ